MVPGVSAENLEGVVDRQTTAFGENPLCLFDHDAGNERRLELGSDEFAFAQRTFVQDCDGRHVREGLAEPCGRLAESAWLVAEQVQRAEDLLPQPQGESVD